MNIKGFTLLTSYGRIFPPKPGRISAPVQAFLKDSFLICLCSMLFLCLIGSLSKHRLHIQVAPYNKCYQQSQYQLHKEFKISKHRYTNTNLLFDTYEVFLVDDIFDDILGHIYHRL